MTGSMILLILASQCGGLEISTKANAKINAIVGLPERLKAGPLKMNKEATIY